MNRRLKKEINYLSLPLDLWSTFQFLIFVNIMLVYCSCHLWIHLSLVLLTSYLPLCSVLPCLPFSPLLYFIFSINLNSLQIIIYFLMSLQPISLQSNAVYSQHLEQSLMCSNHSECLLVDLIMVVLWAEVWYPVADEILLKNHQLLTINLSELIFIGYLLCTINYFRHWGYRDEQSSQSLLSHCLSSRKKKQINEKIIR